VTRTPEKVDRSGAAWCSFDKTRRHLAAEKLSLRGKIQIGTDMLLHPDAVKRAISYARSSKAGGKGPRCAIVAFSDIHGNLGQQMQWGDFWVKQALTEAITSLGGIVVEPFMQPDVMIHLFGGYYDLPPAREHVLWIHSHPEKLAPQFLRSYDRTYCISRMECDSLAKAGVTCTWLPMATGKRAFRTVGKIREEVVFVGNALPTMDGHRRIVDDMLQVLAKKPDIKFSVWGGLYRDLPPEIHMGDYLPYYELDHLYAHSAIVLNDHRPEMRERSFINPRILDVIAAGGFVVSDKNTAINDIFGDAVPQYSDAEELAAIIKTYLGHPELRMERMQPARTIVAEYTWQRVAATLMGKDCGGQL